MPVINRNDLKAFFSFKKKPTEGQFSSLIDSFWHKLEAISIADVAGLSTALGTKADASAVANLQAQITALSQTANIAPNVNAGADVVLHLPVTGNVVLTGTATDPDGTIASRVWTKLNGAEVTILNATSLEATIPPGAWSEGEYNFRFGATDNKGMSSFDDRKVTVIYDLPQIAITPIGNIQAPANSVNLSAAITPGSAAVQTITWSKVSGGASNIANASVASTTATGLEVGNYTFKCFVLDVNGRSFEQSVSFAVTAGIVFTNTVNFAASDSVNSGGLSAYLATGEATNNVIKLEFNARANPLQLPQDMSIYAGATLFMVVTFPGDYNPNGNGDQIRVTKPDGSIVLATFENGDLIL